MNFGDRPADRPRFRFLELQLKGKFLNTSESQCKLKGTVTHCKVERAQIRHAESLELGCSIRL